MPLPALHACWDLHEFLNDKQIQTHLRPGGSFSWDLCNVCGTKLVSKRRGEPINGFNINSNSNNDFKK